MYVPSLPSDTCTCWNDGAYRAYYTAVNTTMYTSGLLEVLPKLIAGDPKQGIPAALESVT
jgi:hypothetical protein